MIKFRNVVRKANKAKDIFDAVVVYVGLGLDGELMTNYKIELNHARLHTGSIWIHIIVSWEDYYPGPAKY